MNSPTQLSNYELALLQRDHEDHEHQKERLMRYRIRGYLAAMDLQTAIRHNCHTATKTWSASSQLWFTEWLMLRNPVIGRKCIVLAPSRQ